MTFCFLGGADYPCRNGTEGHLYLRGPEVITPTDDSATCKGLCTLGDLPRAPTTKRTRREASTPMMLHVERSAAARRESSYLPSVNTFLHICRGTGVTTFRRRGEAIATTVDGILLLWSERLGESVVLDHGTNAMYPLVSTESLGVTPSHSPPPLPSQLPPPWIMVQSVGLVSCYHSRESPVHQHLLLPV